MKRTVKKAVVIGLSTVMVVAGSVFCLCGRINIIHVCRWV